MNTAQATAGITNASRERAAVVVSAAAALAVGLFAAVGSGAWLGVAGLGLVLAVAAWTLPLAWVAVILTALIPLQLYAALPNSSFTVRGAVIFVFAAGLRVLGGRLRWQSWMAFPGVFLLAAVIAALGAPDRYLALKGIYDWLPVFAAVLVGTAVARSEIALHATAAGLIAAGLLEAVLGLLQYAFGLTAVLDVLRMPASEWFLQPNLLRERLVDLSFNWIAFERVVPFGTFINGIDYAVFLAAILSFVLGLGLAAHSLPDNRMDRRRTLVLSACAVVMGAALLLTFKGSGLIAAGAGLAGVIVLLGVKSHRLRLSSHTLAALALIVLAAGVLALPLAGLLQQRLAFLVEREQGGIGVGRLQIWSNLLGFFIQRPLFGFGLNNSGVLAEPLRTLSGGRVAFLVTSPESGYIATLVETGLVGFCALLGLFGAALVRGYHAVRSGRAAGVLIGIIAAIAALLLGNLTVSSFTTDQNGMLLGLLIGMVLTYGISDR